MRARLAFVLGTAVLIVTACGASHRAAAGDTVGFPPEPPHVALISARNGARQRFLNLPLNAAVPDGHGGWFVGGGVGLARLRPDGRLDRSWSTHPSVNFVACLLIGQGSRLYVEGADRVEAFDAPTGKRLWASPQMTPKTYGICGGTVQALAASSTKLYVAGNFTRVGGVPRRSLAALDARTGRLLDWRSPRLDYGAAEASIAALAFSGSSLYIGGLFSAVGGHSRNEIAALDPRTGALLRWKPANVGDVDTIVVTHGEVITAGHDGFGATAADTGRRLSWTSRLGGVASAFAGDGPLVYLGADLRNSLRSVDGRRRHNLAAFNLASGRFTSWAPNLAPYVTVGTIAPSGDKVLVIGTFTNTVG